MEKQSIIITDDKPITISQTTDNTDGREIQTVILTLKESEEIIEFN